MAHILCIHAHPDDAEILAGGTLALLSELGHSIAIVTMTPGDCGSADRSADDISHIRRREAADAAVLIGADYRCAEFRDLAIFNTDDARRRVTEIIRRARPDLVITAAPVDYHCDHEATSVLVRDACFAASAPNYRTSSSDPAAALSAIPHLYFVDSVAGINRFGFVTEPEFVVDVSSAMDVKKRMLAAHASQREWLRRQHGIDDYIPTMEKWTRERGSIVGVDYGEGFRRYAGHPYPQTSLLEELLGGRVFIHTPVSAR
ncbi:MAG: PIG-L family deacetylase [Bryobacteraceae bacterium]